MHLTTTNRYSTIRLGFVAAVAMMLLPSWVFGVNFVFDIEYFGNDATQLAPGSDEPTGLLVSPGDSFQWTIAPVDDRYWLVESGGSFFPLMAFNVNPSGSRTGDFDLILRNNGADVFNLMEVDVENQEVHLGTNTVELPIGLEFDEMFLDYSFTSAADIVDPFASVETTIADRLPIFGAPENNTFFPGIVFVPEPDNFWMPFALVLGYVPWQILRSGVRRSQP